MRLTAAGNPTITGRLSVATARDLFTDAVVRAEWLEHIRAGRAFGIGYNVAAPGVGNFAIIRLNNPVGSGKVLLLFAAHAAGVAGPSAVVLSSQGAAFADPNQGFSLLTGLAGGVARALGGSLAFGPASPNIMQKVTPAGQDVEFLLGGGVEIAAGNSWLLHLGTANGQFLGGFLWAEV